MRGAAPWSETVQKIANLLLVARETTPIQAWLKLRFMRDNTSKSTGRITIFCQVMITDAECVKISSVSLKNDLRKLDA